MTNIQVGQGAGVKFLVEIGKSDSKIFTGGLGDLNRKKRVSWMILTLVDTVHQVQVYQH